MFLGTCTSVDSLTDSLIALSTARRVGVETRGAAADNILACSSFMTRGYEPGRAITPRIFSALAAPPSAFLAFAGKLGTGCQFLGAYRTINWKRDVCYLTLPPTPSRSHPLLLPTRSFVRDSVHTLVQNISYVYPSIITNVITRPDVDKFWRNIAICAILFRKKYKLLYNARANCARWNCRLVRTKRITRQSPVCGFKDPGVSGAHRIKRGTSRRGSTVRSPIIHWLKPSTEQLMRPTYRRVRGDHSLVDRHNNPAEIADRRNVCRRGTVAADVASIWPAPRVLCRGDGDRGVR
ncbi:hypothetical protein DBV15_10548 [Temnothorax longispinosus]|uniref:Uncharacterized protein n=1 Tax=Temnothorax longispinosus TaxID=300112 RepID=A0A4V3SCG1_9HYME|nr:hypothetical protein DBV15_10548 [Temnothorax longispinosus]